jgi:hypothetical protein
MVCCKLFARLALNHVAPDLSILSSWDYRCEPGTKGCFNNETFVLYQRASVRAVRSDLSKMKFAPNPRSWFLNNIPLKGTREKYKVSPE